MKNKNNTIRTPHRYYNVYIFVVVPVWGSYLHKVNKAISSVYPAKVTLVTDQKNKNSSSIKKLEQQVHQIIFVENPTIGKAREIGRKNTFGKLVLFMDADDELKENALLALLTMLNQNPHCVASCGTMGRKTRGGTWPTPQNLKLGCSPIGKYVLLFKNVLPTIGVCLMVKDRLPDVLFPELEDEDWHAAIRLRRKGKICFTPEPLMTYYDTPGSVSRSPRKLNNLEHSHNQLSQPNPNFFTRMVDMVAKKYRYNKNVTLVKQWEPPN